MVGTIFLVLLSIAAETLAASAFALPNPIDNHVKIIGGSEAEPHEFGFFVDVRRDGRHFCSGSIVDKDWILLPAHCATAEPSSYQIVAGDHDISGIDGREQLRPVTHIIVHPEYTRKFVGKHDLALMHLSSSLNFNQYVQAVTLRPAENGPSPLATVIGWGDGSSTTTLQKVTVTLVANPVCARAYDDVDPSENSMICYGEDGKGPCQGDSGGALLCNGQLCGMASAGKECGFSPTLFAEVSNEREFIYGLSHVFAEDEGPKLQTRACGGLLEETSGQIELNSLAAGQTCMWTVRVRRSQTRVRLVHGFLDSGLTVFLTPFGLTDGPRTTTQLTALGQNHTVLDTTMFFITVNSGAGFTNAPVVIEYFGSEFYTAPLAFTNFDHLSGSSGSLSYPKDGAKYRDNENTLFVVQGDKAPLTLEFTRLDTQGHMPNYCIIDYIIAYEWDRQDFKEVTRLCGNVVPGEALTSNGGHFLLHFITDHEYRYGGFDLNWL